MVVAIRGTTFRRTRARWSRRREGGDPVQGFLASHGEAGRRVAMGTLPRRLTVDEQAKIFSFMGGTRPADIDSSDWQRLVNDTLDRLGTADSAPEGMGRFLIALWRNEKADPVLRDYALQFIGNWHTAVSRSAGGERDPAVRAEMITALGEALRQPGQDWSAVALLSLQRIRDAGARVGRNEIAPDRFVDEIRVLLSDRAKPAVRLTALQVAARMRLPGTLELARQLASDPTQPATLRMSAISAIGQLGGDSDAAALREIAAGQDPRLRFAGNEAIQRLASPPAEAPRKSPN